MRELYSNKSIYGKIFVLYLLFVTVFRAYKISLLGTGSTAVVYQVTTSVF